MNPRSIRFLGMRLSRRFWFVVIITFFLLTPVTSSSPITSEDKISVSQSTLPTAERIYGRLIIDEIYEAISISALIDITRTISENGSRYIESSGSATLDGQNKDAREYIVRKLVSLSNGRIEVDIRGTYQNIIGKLPGYLPGDHPAFIVSAHYDSPSGCPGANCNAAGVAAMLELARVMSQYEWPLDIYFMSFNGVFPHGPELTYYLEGSEEIATELMYQGFETLAIFNIDTVLYPNLLAPSDRRVLLGFNQFTDYCKGKYWADLTRTVSNNFGRNSIAPVPSIEFPFWAWGDHYAFATRGFSGALCAYESGSGIDDYYHDGDDVWDNPEYDYGLLKELTGTIGGSMSYIMGRTYNEPRRFDYSIITGIGNEDSFYIPITTSTNLEVSCRWFGGPATFELRDPNNQLIESAVYDSASAWEYTDVFDIAVSLEGPYTLSLINTGVQSIGFELTYTYESDIDNNGILDSQEFWIDSSYFTLDQDSDGLSFANELFLGSDDSSVDTDNDLIPDKFEVDNGLDPTDPSDGSADADGDGLSNAQEYIAGLDMFSADTDSDNMPDLWEIENGLNPLVNDAMLDADGDGKTNLQEYLEETDPQQQEVEPLPVYLWYVIPTIIIAPIIVFLYVKREHNRY